MAELVDARVLGTRILGCGSSSLPDRISGNSNTSLFLHFVLHILDVILLSQGLIIYVGSFYILLGIIFLLIPLIYIEVGRPKDFFKAALNLIIGVILIIKKRVFENSYSAVYLLITLLFVFYLVEIFSIRWNQLTDKEKNKLTTLVEFKKNLFKISQAFSLGLGDFKNTLNLFKFDRKDEKTNKKKWVRNHKNDNIET